MDKPADWTSFDVVNKIRFTIAKELNVKPKHMKVGHSGTLDPKATGLLLLAVGKATKQMSELLKQDKSYEVGAILGSTSTTGDSEGDISMNQSAKAPGLDKVQEVVNSYIGDIQQKPHNFSAVKVGGVRAYKLARQGQKVNLEPRKVTVYSITKLKYDWPLLTFDTKVSSGVYIRSLVEDIGRDLEVGAYMNSLRRTEIGKYKISDASSVDDLDFQTIWDRLVPLD